MKRRFMVEVDAVDVIPGAVLEIITRIAGELERMKKEDLIVDYGVGLDLDVSWFVKIAALAPEPKELGHGAAEEVQGTSLCDDREYCDDRDPSGERCPHVEECGVIFENKGDQE